MQTTLLISPKDLDLVRSSLSVADDVTEVSADSRHSLDAKDVVAVVLEFADRQNAMLLLAFILGTRTSFQVDQNGVRVEVRNLKTLSKLWKAWKSIDDSQTTTPAPPIETDQNVP